MPATPVTLSITAAAAYLGVSERTMNRIVGDRKVRYTQLASRKVFDPVDLDAYRSRQGIGPVEVAE